MFAIRNLGRTMRRIMRLVIIVINNNSCLLCQVMFLAAAARLSASMCNNAKERKNRKWIFFVLEPQRRAVFVVSLPSLWMATFLDRVHVIRPATCVRFLIQFKRSRVAAAVVVIIVGVCFSPSEFLFLSVAGVLLLVLHSSDLVTASRARGLPIP